MKSCVCLLSLLCLLVACTDDEDKIQEPMVEDVDTSQYQDDPAMVEEGSAETEEPSPFGEDGEPEDGVGELTDPSFSDTNPETDFSEPGAEGLGDDSSEPDPAPESDMQDLYQESFEDQPGYDVTEPVAGGAVVPDSAFEDTDGDGDGEVIRYVDALLLNVRSSPDFSSPIVRRLLGGAKISVTIQGRFAKIREGQYVSTKYLSSSPTRKVSRNEVTEAWRKSKYKDTWVPPR